MEKDPRRRQLGSVLQVLELVTARMGGRVPLFVPEHARPRQTPERGAPFRRLIRRPGWQGEAPVVILAPPVPGGAVRTISGALVVMPARPLRGIRAPRKPEATPLIGRPRPARGA